jgi:hypothetical protein
LTNHGQNEGCQLPKRIDLIWAHVYVIAEVHTAAKDHFGFATREVKLERGIVSKPRRELSPGDAVSLMALPELLLRWFGFVFLTKSRLGTSHTGSKVPLSMSTATNSM